MKYAAVIVYTPDKARIQAARPAHREYLMGKKAEGKVALGGPLQDDVGGIIVYATDSAAEAETLIREDPFNKQGVFVSWEIKPWNLILCNHELMPA
jgi:uncharacterized protein YciI